MQIYHNPYSGLSFFQALFLFFERLPHLIKNGFHLRDLASDEQQILILLAIAVSGGLVGSLLIFRKMTMLANALSHTVLFGIVITFLIIGKSFSHFQLTTQFSVILVTSLITGLLTVVLAEMLTKINRLHRDAAIGLVFTTLFAGGILLITIFSRNSHIGVELITGNIDALHVKEIPPVLRMTLWNILCSCLFIRGLKIMVFDTVFARLQGFFPALFKYLLILQLSMTVVGSFKAVGVVLILGFLIVPPSIARFFARSLQALILMSVGIGCLGAVIGVLLSRHLLTVYGIPLSTAGLTVCTLYGFHLFSFLAVKISDHMRKPALQTSPIETPA